MPSTDSDSAVIKIIGKDDESCSKSDLETQMEEFYKLLNSESIDSENASNNKKCYEVCKQLVKSDAEVCDCNSINGIMSNKPLCISSEIDSNSSIPHFISRTKLCDESDLESEINAFHSLLKPNPIEDKDASLNKILHTTDPELESNKSIARFALNQMLECQTDISGDKCIVPESGKSNLESEILKATECDDNSDKINLDPIEKDKYSNQSSFLSEIRECNQQLTAEFSKDTKLELEEEIHKDTNYSSMSYLKSESDDVLSIFCKSDLHGQKQLQNSKFLECVKVCVANKNNTSFIDNKMFAKGSEMKVDFNSDKCKQVAKSAFQNEVNKTLYQENVSNFTVGDSSISEAIGNETLILCCENDLDDDIEDATISDTENDLDDNIEDAIISDTENDLDDNIKDSTISDTENDFSGNPPSPDEFVIVAESDGNGTLILCCESEIDDCETPIKRHSDGKESVTNKIEQNKADPTRDFYKKEKNDVIDEICKSPVLGHSDKKESVTNEVEQNKADPTRDFYEKEKADVIDPRWQHVKELSTNEERYQQVKSCWGSTTVPDPDRNLTYHSYRKRQFRESKVQNNQIRRHKRQASANLTGNETKRLRSCTYLFDDKITAIAKKKEEQTMEIMKEMKSQIRKIEIQHHQEKVYLQNLLPSHHHRGYNFHTGSFLDMQIMNLQQEHQRQVACTKDEFQRTIHQNDAKYRSELNSLNDTRNEVLQFYSFYKGVNKHRQDLTLLNDSQLKELDDIENFYSQMNDCYK